MRDEYRALLPGAAADALAGRAMLLSEFLAREKPELALKPLSAHGVRARPLPPEIVRRVPGRARDAEADSGTDVKPIASSCCGMAGSFGYQAETQEVSRAMAEAGLLPAVRKAAADDIIVADGTSCRHQIRDLGGREAIHSVRVLERALA